MRKIIWSLIAALLIPAVSTPSFAASGTADGQPAESSYRGWDFLVARLKADGVDQADLDKIYRDPRMPECGPIPFKLHPKEVSSIYAGFLKRDRIEEGRRFLSDHKAALDAASRRFKVNPSVVAALLLIESRYGANTGNALTINRLSRLAALGSPENIEFNYERLRDEEPKLTREKLTARAHYLAETFRPEIAALISVAKQNELDPLEFKGSFAGAFGIPQFLPSSYLKYGVDGNGDGKVSLFNIDDAIFSTANFLHSSGWDDRHSQKEKRKVLWKYNKSDEYVSAVLKVAARIMEPAPRSVESSNEPHRPSQAKAISTSGEDLKTPPPGGVRRLSGGRGLQPAIRPTPPSRAR